MTNEQYYEMIRPYQDALNLLMARLVVFNHTVYDRSQNQPLHNIQSRIKGKRSIEEKLDREGHPPSVSCAKDYLRDIAGIRVICYFVSDVELLVKNLKSQSDLIVIKEKDYIRNPKPNGYRSYHIVLGVSVCYLDCREYYPVEVQIRTLGMDFWASMEHRICYKQERGDKDEVQQILIRYAGILGEMEEDFEKYNDRYIEDREET